MNPETNSPINSPINEQNLTNSPENNNFKPNFDLAIVVPTYNEKGNINELLGQVQEVVENNKIKTLVLVMDDNSPDGTSQIVESFITKNQSPFLTVQIKVRPGKMGLSSAYKQGFSYILANYKSQYLMEMDADLSHKPMYIPQFIAQAKLGFQAVFGSRYVAGGGVENWGWLRRKISFFGSLYTRTILGLPIRDFTGGYNFFAAEIFDKLELDSILAEGYLFNIEIKYRLAKLGYKFCEVPIIFPDRTAGKSKFSKQIILEAVLGVWKLRGQKIEKSV
jgi:dolichol-phosphate mannosyltransferase